jgi:uncharacterized repeat protein (TIGR04138 family)
MDPQTPIDFDLPCRRCDYNLRTLAVTARCPECGFPALRTFMAHQVDPTRSVPLEATLAHQSALLVLARLLRRNVDAISFVLTAFDFRRQGRRGTLGRSVQPPGIDAPKLCRSIRDYALFRYGGRDEAIATLRFWRIERSEDVGEIVAALVEGGLLTPSQSDSPGDFAGLFTLDELFPDQ